MIKHFVALVIKKLDQKALLNNALLLENIINTIGYRHIVNTIVMLHADLT